MFKGGDDEETGTVMTDAALSLKIVGFEKTSPKMATGEEEESNAGLIVDIPFCWFVEPFITTEGLMEFAGPAGVAEGAPFITPCMPPMAAAAPIGPIAMPMLAIPPIPPIAPKLPIPLKAGIFMPEGVCIMPMFIMGTF